MNIRAVTMNDWQIWINLAHEGDKIVKDLISDISIFYEGFDKYMKSKILQNEAYMATDEISGECIGIVAFSRKNNRITFFAVSKIFDLEKVGSKLIEFTLNKLDCTKEISVNVLKHEKLLKEKELFHRFKFIEYDDSIFEAGVPACMMKRYPILK